MLSGNVKFKTFKFYEVWSLVDFFTRYQIRTYIYTMILTYHCIHHLFDKLVTSLKISQALPK